MLSIIRKPCLRRATALLLVLVLCLSPLSALAGEYDITNGSITVIRDEVSQRVTQKNNDAVQNKEDNDPVITSNKNEVSVVTLTVQADEGQTANVTLKDLNINNKGAVIYGVKNHRSGRRDPGAGRDKHPVRRL